MSFTSSSFCSCCSPNIAPGEHHYSGSDSDSSSSSTSSTSFRLVSRRTKGNQDYPLECCSESSASFSSSENNTATSSSSSESDSSSSNSSSSISSSPSRLVSRRSESIEASRPQSRKNAGSPRMGNTSGVCAVLQAILADNDLIDTIRNVLRTHGSNPMPVSEALMLMADGPQYLSIRRIERFSRLFAREYPGFESDQGTDAHEFLINFIDLLEEELSQSDVSSGYYLSQQSIFKCLICGQRSGPWEEKGLGLSVSIPEKEIKTPTIMHSRWDLGSLLWDCFQEELIQRRCENCSGRWSIVKSRLSAAPRCLVVHINRLNSNGGRTDAPVHIPQQLSLELLLPDAEVPSTYLLYSVVRHCSSRFLPGRYESDILKSGDSWNLGDDGSFFSTCPRGQQDKQGYLCFYKLI